MRKIAFIVLLLLCFTCAHAETIVLRTGTRVKGTIVFQNEEVVIIRDEATGARFQYPRADIASIGDEGDSEEEREKSEELKVDEIKTSKKASILLELAGGAAIIPAQATGGGMSADLLVGSHHIGNRHVFFGGGLGYHGLFIGAEKYNFLPIQLAVRVPFTEEKHAPVFGLSLGYGIALSKDYTGGIYAGMDFGYRCQLNPKTAIAIVGYAHFQQATLYVPEMVEGVEFINKTGRYLISPGVKMALYF